MRSTGISGTSARPGWVRPKYRTAIINKHAMKKVLNKIKELFLEMLPAFVFFLIMFHLLLITRALILQHHGIASRASTVAVISALIVAKVVLIANRIPFLNLYPKKPLIHNVVLKTIVFSIFTMLFMTLEELLRLSRTNGGFPAAWGKMTSDFAWPFFFLREAWIFILILLYCAGAELTRVIGKDKVREIFFGRKT
jgi:hypothetical protein